MTCPELSRICETLRGEYPDYSQATFDKRRAHKATCPACQESDRAASASYRVPASWRSVAHVEPCAGGCQWSDVAGVRVCWKCGQVKP